MQQFFEGIIACMAILSALSGYLFARMEKRLENKLNCIEYEIDLIANKLKEERINRDALYKLFLDKLEK